jgi:hypothetical protein
VASLGIHVGPDATGRSSTPEAQVAQGLAGAPGPAEPAADVGAGDDGSAAEVWLTFEHGELEAAH